MDADYDVVIIGAGVIGCATARELSRLDLRILVIDRASDVSEGASKANSGIVHAGFDALPGSCKARLNRLGQPLIRRWADELAVPYRNNTSLVIALDPDETPSLQTLLDRGRQNGIDGLRLLTPEETLQREANLNPVLTGALLAETGGIISPYGLTIALAEHAAVNGVIFWLNCPVHSINRECQPGANYFQVHTTRGVVSSRAVVNAAGVFADELNNGLSQDQFTITARRGEYWMFDKTVGSRFCATVFLLPTPRGKGVLVSPTVEHTLITGPTSEDLSDKADTRTTAAKRAEILRAATRIAPGLPMDQFITSFSGLRAHCDRNDFIVDRVADVPGYYRAAGIDSPGLTAAPAIAIELSHLIAEDLDARLRQDFLPPPTSIPSLNDLDPVHLADWIAREPGYGRMVCRCEQVSEAQIRDAIRRPLGARTLDGIKRRTRANMGRCQGGFCTPRVLAILSEELGMPETALTKFGGQSQILTGTVADSQLSPELSSRSGTTPSNQSGITLDILSRLEARQ